MRKLIALLLALCLLGCGLTACQSEPAPTEPPQTAKPTEPPLDFTVADASGKSVKLSDLAGKPVVVNFWATWCNPCTTELPEFDAAAKTNPEIQFMMINATDGRDEKQEKVEAFLQEHGYTFPVYYDHAMTTIQQLGIQAFPTTLFIDAEGYVVDSHVGMLNAQELDSYLALLH